MPPVPIAELNAIDDPSGDHVGSNSIAGAEVSRRTPVPLALIDQMSFVSSENTSVPCSDRMEIRGPDADGETIGCVAVGRLAAGEPDVLVPFVVDTRARHQDHESPRRHDFAHARPTP